MTDEASVNHSNKNQNNYRKSGGYGLLRRRKFFESIEKRRTKPEKLQIRFEKFGQVTTLHGVRNLTQANNWPRRIFWFIVLSVSLTCLAHEINQSVREYYTFSTYTELHHVTKVPMTFPIITICNNNMFKLDRIVPVFDGGANFFTKGLKFIRELFPKKGLTNLNQSGDFNQPKEDNNWKMNMRNLVESNGHRKEDMIVSCVFNSRECGTHNFHKIITNYGLCYNFQMTSMEVNNSGPSLGLSLILDAEHLQYVAAPREKVGFRVTISTRDQDVDVITEGLDIAVGMGTSIGISRLCTKSLPAPYSNCVPTSADPTCDVSPYSDNFFYSKSACIQQCESAYFMDLCNCLVFYSSNDSAPFCSPIQYMNCYRKYEDTFSREKNRICNCPEPCDITRFHKTLSFSTFPSLSVANTLYVTKKPEYFGKALGWKIRQVTFTNSEQKREFIIGTTPSFLNSTFQGHRVDESILTKYLRKVAFDVFSFVEVEVTDKMFEVLDHKYNVSISKNSKFYFDVKERARKYVLNVTGVMYNVILNMIDDVDSVNDSGTKMYFSAFYDNLFDSIYQNISVLSFEAANLIEKTSSSTERTTEYLRNTFSKLDIYYDNVNIEMQIDRSRYSIAALLGNLGGTLGLFFGASLLAFIEAMEFWFLNDSCRGKRRHNVNSV